GRGHRPRTAPWRRRVPLRGAGRLRRARDQLHHLHLLVHRRAGRDRAHGRGARAFRARAGAPQPPGPALGGHGLRGRRGLGQLPADLLARGPDHRRDAAVAFLAGGLMSRLVVVSNRVAVPGENRAGGLAVALQAAPPGRGGMCAGSRGKPVRGTSGEIHEQAADGIRYATMDLNRPDLDAYYNGFANRALWPLLHFRLDLVDYDRATREGYRRVNAMFADRLAPMLRDDDTVWVHDYHLIPLGALLRERGVGCRIGFYLHVPVPSADLMMAVPDHQRLFSPLYAYDLLGFQTQRDNDRFHSYVRLYGGGRIVGPGLLEAPGGRRFRTGAFPISIDTPEIARQAASAINKPAVRSLRTSLEDRLLAIGVDRLDYSKGLPERFHGFERYLRSEEHTSELQSPYTTLFRSARGAGWTPLPHRRVPDQHRYPGNSAPGGERDQQARGTQPAHQPGGPAAGDRRGPAGLLQGPARALPRLRMLPAAAPGPEGHPDLPADRAAVARRRQRIPHPAQPAGADRRAHQRRPCRAQLDPAALRQPQLPACHPHRLLPHRTGWPGHPAARRHEPGGQ